MAPVPALVRFWRTDLTRDNLLRSLDRADLRSVRLVCREFGMRSASILFAEMDITFRSTTFTRPARMAALERIGCHVRAVTVWIPHSSETFLPPLLDPVTGEEKTTLSIPRKCQPHNRARPSTAAGR